MKIYVALIFLLICASACQNKSKSEKKYDVVPLPKDDSNFLALKDTAQAHLQTFIDSLNIHGNETKNYRFGVKSDFVENGIHEHMWSQILKYDEGCFKGIFIDSAFNLKHIKIGDKVSINRKAIEDWSVYNTVTRETIGDYSAAYLDAKRKR
jgi:uncharacterized protein YegJ (DUF2314 family)